MTTATQPAPAADTQTSELLARIQLTGFAFAYVLLAVPALVLLCVLTTALPMVAVGVGALLLLIFVPLNRQLANLHRRIAGRILGVPIEEPYRLGYSHSPLGQLRGWSKDPSRWRDWLWTFVSVTAGWAIAWVGVGLFLGVAWYVVFPFVFWVTPDGVFDMNYGIFTIDTVEESFFEWVWAAVAGFLWWRFIGPLMRLRARLDRALLAPSREALEKRVAQVSASRAETIDHSATELRRIERDLHDGAQARLVSLGMSLGMAEQLIEKDPAEAVKLLAEARSTTTSALGDLRSVVRGIHPPVLADRGLAGAVQALALDLAIPVTVMTTLPGRAPDPVESAAYFAVAECLANMAKHSGATRGSVDLRHTHERLRLTVTDDGDGGADLGKGTGLQGVARRLAAFDGTMDVVSPAGGPTTVTMEIPCALSSPRTSPSSGTD